MLLSDARSAIRAELQKLFECPRALRPFVIVQDTVTEKFVQFAGSMEEGAFLDVPALGIMAQIYPVPLNAIHNVDVAVEQAVLYLKMQGLPEFAELRVSFETTQEDEPS
jgi:hypothetical protein